MSRSPHGHDDMSETITNQDRISVTPVFLIFSSVRVLLCLVHFSLNFMLLLYYIILIIILGAISYFYLCSFFIYAGIPDWPRFVQSVYICCRLL
ncbi:hypothetical protein Lalb_Chr12g0197781 [Lupinus albus]|uniref:Uncharacterized protein n=1 Tax=Lupinus albus TaxID=3870 RepID=A0A6A4PL77_LUPAL|nr:hypothetical protein Lalb_Chr12g0197781 [Lupinus albus]